MRRYAYVWGSYDSLTNRPYLHLFTFDQEREQDPLDREGPVRDRFLAIVHGETERIGKLHTTILSLDTQLDGIYPKVIKRICLGPFYSEYIFEARDQAHIAMEESMVRELLKVTGSADDFILCGSEELIVSIGEDRLNKNLIQSFTFRKSVRQVFLIPDTHSGLTGSGVSRALQFALMPHRLVQEVPGIVDGLPPELGREAVLYPYGEKGVLYV